MATVTNMRDFFGPVRNEKDKTVSSQNDIPGFANIRSERHATIYGGHGINTDFKIGSPVVTAEGKQLDNGTYQVLTPTPGALTVADGKVSVWSPVKAVNKPATTKLSAMRGEAYKDGLVNAIGEVKTAMKFSVDPKHVHSNVPSTSTQLDRFRTANRFAHLKCSEAFLAESKPENPVRIVYTGQRLTLGAEVAVQVKDGYDLLPDSEWVTTDKDIFRTKEGRIVELRKGMPSESWQVVLNTADKFSKFKTYFTSMSKK